MSPLQLKQYLNGLIANNIKQSIMIWGKPGIGKSSLVKQVCEEKSLQFIDLRLSQLMPSDLRGIPVPRDERTHWLPPSFLPLTGRGVLFMDEVNMAPPALQGVAQQLILDRQVGDYQLPDEWFIWAAGNRKSDKAVVYEMPATLANRFIHFSVEESLDDFKQYAYRVGLSADVIGFLSFRPDLLHRLHVSDPSWPSPRTWEMAATLHQAGLNVAPAVGAAVAMEFDAFVQLRHQIPDLDAILEGKSPKQFPEDPSVRYATIAALVSRISQASQAVSALLWLIHVADEEWVHLFASDLFPRLRETRQYPAFAKEIVQDERAKRFLSGFVSMIS